MIDSEAWQQHAVRHSPAAVIDSHAADASPVTSDAPTNAARAIHEKRNLERLIGIFTPEGSAVRMMKESDNSY